MLRAISMSPRRKAKRWVRERTPAGTDGGLGEARAADGQARKRWFALLIAGAVGVVIVFVSLLVVLFGSDGEPDGSAAVPTFGPRAAIVDQLALTQPNPGFVQTATDLLKQAGYAVDYHPGEEITVEFYRKFPSQRYDLIIFRVHSALGREDGEPADWVTLFTADEYHESWYVDEQKTRRLSMVSYYENGPSYFGIMPDFIRSSMKGDLRNTTVILMGCDGLATDTVAKALVDKGAKAVVSWSGLVSGDHTDAAAEHLLRHLVTEGLPLSDAVEKTAAEVGPDPTYGSDLRLYPPP
jgi:hypothetical protein